MKTLFITLILTMELTDAVHAGGWAWFHGDIGLSSPFASSSPPANEATRAVVFRRKVSLNRKRLPTGPSQDNNSSQLAIASTRGERRSLFAALVESFERNPRA
jgi:hypothetical protein